jgi:hypothetical protein
MSVLERSFNAIALSEMRRWALRLKNLHDLDVDRRCVGIRLRRGHGNHRSRYREGRPSAGLVLAPVP